MFGAPADDRPVQFTGIAIWEVRNGKLAYNWVERSAYELSQQLKQAKLNVKSQSARLTE